MKRGNGIEQLFPTKKLRAQFEGITSTLDRFQRKALKYPSASEDGYIFRGELNYKTPLQSSLERKLWKRNEWKDSAFIPRHQIAAAEKRIVEDFVHEAKAGVATLVTNHNSNQWPPPGERDVFWWLALMQHYDQPTRLIDFSLDVYVALFFALEHYFKLRGFDPLTSSEPNLAIYCFPCRDTKTENPADTNKTPIAPSSSGIDMSRALGALMKLDCMADCKFEEERLSDQKFAWDRPHFENPRLRRQQGMFAYPFQYPNEFRKGSGSWFADNLPKDGKFNLIGSRLPAQCLRIPIKKPEVAEKLYERLKSLGTTPATIYADFAKVGMRPGHYCQSCAESTELARSQHQAFNQ